MSYQLEQSSLRLLVGDAGALPARLKSKVKAVFGAASCAKAISQKRLFFFRLCKKFKIPVPVSVPGTLYR